MLLHTLPVELLYQIADHLQSPSNILQLVLTCHRFNAIFSKRMQKLTYTYRSRSHRLLALEYAAKTNNTKLIQYIFQNREPGYPSESQHDNHAVFIACSYGHSDAAKLLLDAGADAMVHCVDPLTPAAALCDIEIVRRILQPLSRDQHQYEVARALCGAAIRGDLEIMKILLDVGVDVDRAAWYDEYKSRDPPCRGDEDYGSALTAAAQFGTEDAVRLLIKHGADPYQFSRCRGSSLMMAAERGEAGMVRFLLEAADYTTMAVCYRSGKPEGMKESDNVMEEMVKTGKEDMIRLLFNSGIPITGAPLRIAATGGRTEMVNFLLELVYSHPSSASTINPDAWTDLHIPGNTEILHILLSRLNGNLKATDPDGNTILHHSCTRPSVISLALAHGADPNARNNLGFSPLHTVCSLPSSASFQESIELISHLVSVGADTNALTSLDHSTPLHLALSNPHKSRTAGYLISEGADFTLVDKNGQTPLHLVVSHTCHYANVDGGESATSIDDAALLSTILMQGPPQKCNVNRTDTRGFTPLHCAAFHNNTLAISRLLEHGADVNARTSSGETPLHLLLSQYREDMWDRVEGVGMLVEAGADITADVGGGLKTPLQMAVVTEVCAEAFWGPIGPLSKLLIEAGAEWRGDEVWERGEEDEEECRMERWRMEEMWKKRWKDNTAKRKWGVVGMIVAREGGNRKERGFKQVAQEWKREVRRGQMENGREVMEREFYGLWRKRVATERLPY